MYVYAHPPSTGIAWVLPDTNVQTSATVIPYAQEKLIYSSAVNVKIVLGEFKLPTL